MKWTILPALAVALLVSLFASAAPSADLVASGDIALPRPAASFGIDLAKAMEIRKSAKKFLDKPVSLENLSSVLWCGLGITKKKESKTSINGVDTLSGASTREDRRAAGFALAMNTLRLYVLTAKAAYLYDPSANRLALVTNGDYRARAGQYFAPAPIVLVVTSDVSLYPPMIKSDMRVTLSHESAGSVVQNIHLGACAIGLGTCTLASINAGEIAKFLRLKAEELPLYTMPLGYPVY